MMRRLVAGWTLISLVACSNAFAQEGQLSSGADGSQKVPRLPSPDQRRSLKNNKQISKAHHRMAPPSSPLSSAETYAAEHSGGLPVSSPAKSALPTTNSWTGFYVGGGIGAGRN